MTVKKEAASDNNTQQGKRAAQFERNTTETQIAIALTIEGNGSYDIRTGIRFFDHMLELFTRHGAFDLQLKCNGDLDVDQHHTVEDVGIALGEAFKEVCDQLGLEISDETGANLCVNGVGGAAA